MEKLLFLAEFLRKKLPPVALIEEVIGASLLAEQSFAVSLEPVHGVVIDGQPHLLPHELQHRVAGFAHDFERANSRHEVTGQCRRLVAHSGTKMIFDALKLDSKLLGARIPFS